MDQSSRSPNPQLSLHATLPIALTSFVGREREISDVARLLASARLVSLIGAGGSGKTRLALKVATEAANQFTDGVGWVELVRLADPALVTQAVAKALNITEQPDMPLLESLLDKLHGRHVLLVLDNCEHVLTTCAELVEALLRNTGVTILATSREPLGVAGEALYPLPPLALPVTPPASRSVGEVSRYDAVRLFVERARSTRPDFALDDTNASTVIDICRRLDGMPLAIELASARVNVLSVAQIAERLDRRLDFLVAQARGDERHRTLRAAIDWSYDLLPPAEQALLQRLTLLAAGFTLGTAEAACAWGEVSRAQVFELVAALVSKSLVIADMLQTGNARYRILETIRQYGQEKLTASGEWAEAHDRYLDCYVGMAEEIDPKLYERDQHLWFKWLEAENDNVRVALAWAFASGRTEAGLRISKAVYQFWFTRGYVREGFGWFCRFLDQADEAVPLAVHVNTLTFGSFAAMFVGDAAAATRWSGRAIAMCEAAGEAGAPLLGTALAGAGSAAIASGDLLASYAIGERQLALMRESGDALMLGMAVFTQGMAAVILGKYETARVYLDEAMALARQADDPYRIAFIFKAMGDLARCEHDYARAAMHYETSLPIFRDLGSTRDIPNIERQLAYVFLRQGDLPRAQALFRQSLEAQRALDHRAGILRALVGLSALAAGASMAQASARLSGFVYRSRDAIPVTDDSGDRADELDYAHFEALARAQLGDAAFEAAQADGRNLSVDQAVDEALGLPLAESTPADGLTAREREIAALIAHGLSNGEIAARLFLSKRTVEKHVANILSKLALTSRTRVVRWAIDNVLTDR